MIWIIGGTSDARKFIESLDNKEDLIITVTTDFGKSLVGDTDVLVGRLNQVDMEKLILEKGIELIIDMSHPYANEVTVNAVNASKNTNTNYYRFNRSPLVSDYGIIAETMDELLGIIKDIEATILFTTGSKDIKIFENVRGNSKHIYRILPLIDSLKIAEDAGVSMKNLICMVGPADLDLNIATINFYGIEYMVMKESGENSGFDEKIDACKKTGVIPIILRRTENEGIANFTELEKIIKNYRNK